MELFFGLVMVCCLKRLAPVSASNLMLTSA
jgi:hypothetical protein